MTDGTQQGQGPEDPPRGDNETPQPRPDTGGAYPPRSGQEPETGKTIDDYEELVQNNYEQLPEEARKTIEDAESAGDLQLFLLYSIAPLSLHGISTEEEAMEFAAERTRLGQKLWDKAESNQAFSDVLEQLSLPTDKGPVTVLRLVKPNPQEESQDTPSDETQSDPPEEEEFEYEALSEVLRQELQRKGVTKENAKLLWQYGKDPTSLTDQERAVVETIARDHPELAERMGRELEHPVPVTDSEGNPISKEEQKRREEIQQELSEAQKRVDAAVKEAINKPGDVEAQEKLAAALQAASEAHEKHGKHGAEGLEKGDPAWTKFLKAFSIAFFISMGIMYAFSSATVEVTKSAK